MPALSASVVTERSIVAEGGPALRTAFHFIVAALLAVTTTGVTRGISSEAYRATRGRCVSPFVPAYRARKPIRSGFRKELDENRPEIRTFGATEWKVNAKVTATPGAFYSRALR